MSKLRDASRWTTCDFQRILAIEHIRRHLIQQGFISERGEVLPIDLPRSPSATRRKKSNDRERKCRSALERQSTIVHGRSSPDCQESESGRRSRLTATTSVSRTTTKFAQSRSPSRTRCASAQGNIEKALITMVYYGPQFILNSRRSRLEQATDDILITQQHCGTQNLVIYKGQLRPNDIFQFESHRHPDFPFALAFYVNGIVHQHLSICCEWRYRSNVRLGGKKGLFGIVYVRNGKPCEKCQERQRRFRTATIKTRRKPIAHSTPNGTAEDIRSLIKSENLIDDDEDDL